MKKQNRERNRERGKDERWERILKSKEVKGRERGRYFCALTWENSHTYPSSKSKIIIFINILMADTIWDVAEKSAFATSLINRISVNTKSKHVIIQGKLL